MRYRKYRHYYLFHVYRNVTNESPNLVPCIRFVELSNQYILPLVTFLRTRYLGHCTGISFIDSTPLRTCHPKREHSHRVMKGFTIKGQCSIGWFLGFKLYCIINDKGEILDIVLTHGYVDDRKPLSGTNLLARVYGRLFGDKGYISQILFEQLFIDGIYLITRIRKNMKNRLMLTSDKILLRKRALIETFNDELRNICQIEHTCHRSQKGFIVNLISELITDHYLLIKPSLNLEVFDPSREHY